MSDPYGIFILLKERGNTMSDTIVILYTAITSLATIATLWIWTKR